MAKIIPISLVFLLTPLALLAAGGEVPAVVAPERLVQIYRETILAQSPWKDKGEILIENVHAPAVLKATPTQMRIVQAKFAPGEDFLGLTTITLVFGDDGALKATVSGMVRVTVMAPVAKNNIQRGALISAADLELKPVDITRFPPLALDIKACSDKRAKSFIRAGAPLLLANIDTPPLIAKGAVVMIEAGNDDLIVTDRGVALMEGRLDERIPVKNLRSGRQIVGTVIAASRIRVEL